jgi:hypothetical protein
MERRKCLIKKFNNGTSRLTACALHPSIVNRSINFLLWTRCQGNAVNTTFCGPGRDTLLSNRKTEKLNF